MTSQECFLLKKRETAKPRTRNPRSMSFKCLSTKPKSTNSTHMSSSLRRRKKHQLTFISSKLTSHFDFLIDTGPQLFIAGDFPSLLSSDELGHSAAKYGRSSELRACLFTFFSPCVFPLDVCCSQGRRSSYKTFFISALDCFAGFAM